MDAQPAKAPLYKRSWFIVVVVIAALTVIGSALSKKDETNTTPASVAATASSQQVETPAPSAPTAPPVVSTPAAVVPSQAPQAAVDFAMPDFVGMDLQSAQDLVQTNGVFFSQSHDLLGSRKQVVDSNWLVCDQNIPAGQEVTGEAEGLIDFGVVKRGEVCP